jgi:hypothetical protein
MEKFRSSVQSNQEEKFSTEQENASYMKMMREFWDML